MRFSLRTLIVLLLVLPPLGAWGWREYIAYRQQRDFESARQYLMPAYLPPGSNRHNVEGETWSRDNPST
jgi:hypothetical protein